MQKRKNSKKKTKATAARKTPSRPKLKVHVRSVPGTGAHDILAGDLLDDHGPKDPPRNDPKTRVAKPPLRRWKSALDYAENMDFDPAFVHTP